MKNKISFFISLFLLPPLTTQCMKRSHGEITKPCTSLEMLNTIKTTPTIKELQIKYNSFKKRLDLDSYNVLHLASDIISERRSHLSLLKCTYLQHLHKKTWLEVLYMDRGRFGQIPNQNFFLDFNIDNLKKGSAQNLTALKNARHGNYSALGSATMAEDISLQEQMEFIQKLRNLGFEPTPEDKELALVERWKRWQPIIKKICLLRHAQFFIAIPCVDVTKFIEWLMLETEKALF